MDAALADDFRQFWKEFFELRGWTHRRLAKILNVNDDVISHWLYGRSAISPQYLSQLLEGGYLSNEEAGRLIRLRLRTLRFSETSLYHIAAGLAKPSQAGQPAVELERSEQERPSILALSPLAGTSPIFYSEVLQALTDRAARSGYHIFVQPIPDYRAKRSLREYHQNLRSLSGVVAINCHVDGSTWLEECRDAGIPIVLFHDNIPPEKLEGGGVASIWEELGGLGACVDHLTRDHGCKQLRVAIAKPEGHYHRQRKLSLIRERAEAHGVVVDLVKHVYPVGQYTYAQGLNVGEDIVALDDEADAVICLNDEVALAIWQTAQRQRRVLRVTGYDNVALAEHFDLTTVDHQRRVTAERALFQLQLDSSLPIVPIATIFIPRASCCKIVLEDRRAVPAVV